MHGIYRYAFERELPKIDFSSRAQKQCMLYREAGKLVELINRYAGKQIEVIALFPGTETSVYVSERLPSSLLEQIAADGYPCTNGEKHSAVSDQAAE